MPPDFVDKRLKFGNHHLEFGEVDEERVLGADGLPDPIGPDLAVIDAPGDPVVVRARLAEIGLHELERLVAHVKPGVEPERIHLCAGRRPDAVKLADRQVFHERRAYLRRYDVLAVWLAV